MTKNIDEQNILKSEVDGKKFPKLSKATELANNYKIRAEKAEAESKELKAKADVEPSKKPEEKETPTKPTETETPKNYSLQDIRALNNVHDDDVERVEKFAKSEDVSIAEALKNDDLKAVIRNRDEQRKIAEAANTGGGKRQTSKTTGKELLKKFDKGEFPDDDKEIEQLAEVHLKERMQR